MTKTNQCTIMSFGFKYGSPNANYYFDVGFAKNPARQNEWSFFSKPDRKMFQFVLNQKSVEHFIELIIPLIEHLIDLDQHQIIAFGCNAGRHRSYVIVEEIVRLLKHKNTGVKIDIIHRDI